MKSIVNAMIFAVIIITCSATLGFCQETLNETVKSRTVSAGIGFPDFQKSFQGHFGLGVDLTPDYEGSDDIDVKAFPLTEIRKPGMFFLQGAGINYNEGQASAGVTVFHLSYSDEDEDKGMFLIGPLVRYYSGRDEGDNEALAGLGDINSSAGLGVFLEFNSGNWNCNLTAVPREVGDDTDGLLVNLDAKHSVLINEKLTVSPGLSISWVDDDYMQGFFGVTETEAAKSGLRQHDTESGFKDVGINIETSYALSKSLSLLSQVGYWRLLNDASDSPIVDDKGAENQYRGQVGLVFRF